MRAIVYSRVSTDAQERDGTSLDTQERACLQFAREQGWHILESVRDAASGFSLDRPGIERVRYLLRAGLVDIIVAYAVDRLSRNQNQIGVMFDEIQQAGARLEFVTERFEDTAVGRFILAARAFIGEVEREKIAERTTRGKIERARSGRMPQGFGRGCYGYVYRPDLGRREIDPFQAEVVRRIFQHYADTRSFERVASELNQDGIRTFDGGRWYAIAIRRVLKNESYTGRLVFRRTRWVKTRGPDGKMRRRQIERPVNEHVEIPGASPRIVDDVLWQRVQQILNDPERIARRPKPKYEYPLRGRVRCLLCGSAMVGQTMVDRGKPYHYYVCRVAFDRRTGRTCAGRNVRADRLEPAIWREIRAKLTTPEVIRQELRHSQPEPDREEVERLERQLASLAERERRLIKLFMLGEFDEAMVQSEQADVKRQRAVLEARLQEIHPSASPSAPPIPEADLVERACQVVGEFLDNAGPEDRALALEALQIAVQATRIEATVHGVVPIDFDFYCQTDSYPDARRQVTHRPAAGITLGSGETWTEVSVKARHVHAGYASSAGRRPELEPRQVHQHDRGGPSDSMSPVTAQHWKRERGERRRQTLNDGINAATATLPPAPILGVGTSAHRVLVAHQRPISVER